MTDKQEPLIPKEFKGNIKNEKLDEYKKLYENKETKLSVLVSVDFIKPLNIFLSAVICLSFYLLLIAIIIKPNTFLIILFAIIIFVGNFTQSQVIPEFPSFKSTEEFKAKIKEILKVDVKIKSKDENNENKSLVTHTIDVTGQIEIPEDIKLCKFDEIIIYSEENICNEFKNKKLKPEICLDGIEEPFFIPEEIYWISDDHPISHPVNGLTIILSLLLLQWIQALYYILIWKMVVIYPIKLAVCEKKEFGKTNINVHGEIFDTDKNILQPNQNDKNNPENIISLDKEIIINNSQSYTSNNDE